MIKKQQAKENVAANLQRILDDRKLEQAQLAEMTGEKPMMISRVVRGLHMPAADVLARIAEALDVSVDRLLGDPPEILEKTT